MLKTEGHSEVMMWYQRESGVGNGGLLGLVVIHTSVRCVNEISDHIAIEADRHFDKNAVVSKMHTNDCKHKLYLHTNRITVIK